MAQCDPRTLLANASCFACYANTPGLTTLIELQLLCEISAVLTGGATTSQLSQGAGAPGTPPTNTTVVNAYRDTNTGNVYWWNPSTSAWE